MLNETIMGAVEALRDVIYTEIKKELLSTPGNAVDIEVKLPCDIDEDRYHTTTITKVYLSDEDDVMVTSTDDLDGEEVTDDLLLYSVNEMLKIVEAI